MINVGDTVHVTDDALKMIGGKHRKEFKVTKISRDSFGNQWIHGDAPFEIWNATELEECTLKFKVGDKVRIVGNTMEKPFSHYLTIGDTATIDRIDANDDVQTYYVLSSDGVYQWVTEKDIEKAEEKAMKFKVGDKVRIKSKAEIIKAYGDVNDMPGSWDIDMDKYCGKTGEIIGFATFGAPRVKFSDDEHWVYGEKALEPVQSTVTITFSGDTTIATDGEHTATVTRYHGDEYSEETGAIEAIKKLYHRFPQKGDVVYFVNTGYGKVYTGSCIFDDTHEIDRLYRKSGNLYKTKAAAQKVADKINAIFKEVH